MLGDLNEDKEKNTKFNDKNIITIKANQFCQEINIKKEVKFKF